MVRDFRNLQTKSSYRSTLLWYCIWRGVVRELDLLPEYRNDPPSLYALVWEGLELWSVASITGCWGCDTTASSTDWQPAGERTRLIARWPEHVFSSEGATEGMDFWGLDPINLGQVLGR